jgi:hypothetical protein
MRGSTLTPSTVRVDDAEIAGAVRETSDANALSACRVSSRA